jgi:monoamine oxidase
MLSPCSWPQAGVISFNPPLPQEKALAIQRVRMGNAVKVILTFSHRFWPEEQYDVVGGWVGGWAAVQHRHIA